VEDSRATGTELTADRAEERAEQGRIELEERLLQAVKVLQAVIQSAQPEAEAEARQPSEQTEAGFNAERAEMVVLQT
jgi:hypothetical protein